MTELSPAARAVLYDYGHEVGGVAAITSYERRGIAAALRAAADQVVPERDCPDTEEWAGQSAWVQAESGARFRLLAIAAELEGGNG